MHNMKNKHPGISRLIRHFRAPASLIIVIVILAGYLTPVVAVRDLEIDRTTDLLETILNKGFSGKAFPASLQDYTEIASADYQPNACAIGDMDLDGDLDIVFGCNSVTIIRNCIFLNDGHGHFSDDHQLQIDTVVTQTYSIVLADMDNDTDLDIVVGNSNEQNKIYYNDAIARAVYTDGACAFNTTTDFGIDYELTQTVAVADMDNDTDLDIIECNLFGQSMIYYNDAGDFSSGAPVGGFMDFIDNIEAGDVNGDNLADLVIGYMGGNTALFLNGPLQDWQTGQPFGKDEVVNSALELGDMNNDGHPDIIEGNSDTYNRVYFNDSSGGFDANNSIEFGPDSCTSVINLADVDCDGDLDIILGVDQGQQNKVYINDGSGNLVEEVNFGSGADNTLSLAAGDLDQDGDPDIVVGRNLQTSLIIYNSGVSLAVKQGETEIDAEGYDFGGVRNGDKLDVDFTIENTGDWDLKLDNLTVDGTDKSEFSLFSQPGTPVAGSENSPFTVRFSPATVGAKTALITIPSNADDQPVYTFTIQGESLPAPEISLTGNSTEIVSGDITPGLDDHTDFGSADVTPGSVVRTFSINNSGSADLLLTGDPPVVLTGDADFSITTQPATPIAAGDKADLQVTFNPLFLGLRQAVISIDNDDPNENPYTFSIQGTGTTTELNIKPDQPVNSSPQNLAVNQLLRPVMQASNFSDNNAGDWQTASQWQIRTAAGNYASAVYDSGTDLVSKTQITVPVGELTTNTLYYWHVRYCDYSGEWSDYSAETAFTTGTIIYVPDDYTTIQGAVNAAVADDTIIVRDGSYNENVIVNKRLQVVSENGASVTSIQSLGVNAGVKVAADNVTVRGFSVVNYFLDNLTHKEYYGTHDGIWLDSVRNCLITGNICSYNQNGIALTNGAENNTLTGNECLANVSSGIIVMDSSNNTIDQNNCHDNGSNLQTGGDGISVWKATISGVTSNNIISNNSIADNARDGLSFFKLNQPNYITDNIVFCDGIRVNDCDNQVFSGNLINGKAFVFRKNASNETIDGIAAGQVVLSQCQNMVIRNLQINRTDNAILLDNCTSCTIQNNVCNSNLQAGIYLDNSTLNAISGNSCNLNIYSGIFLWDSPSNTISRNTCNLNNFDGIILVATALSGENASDNYIYLNNFTNFSTGQTVGVVKGNAFAYGSMNFWRTPDEVDYVYKGSVYHGYLGNYYHDYPETSLWTTYYGQDLDENGVGDEPLPYYNEYINYYVPVTGDEYPLMTQESRQAWWLSGQNVNNQLIATGKSESASTDQSINSASVGASIMYKGNTVKSPGSAEIPSGGAWTWLADSPASGDITFVRSNDRVAIQVDGMSSEWAPVWNGWITFTTPPAEGHSFSIDIGSADADGSNFISGGLQAGFTGDGTQTLFNYFEGAAITLSVPQGKYLALKITNLSGTDYSIQTGCGNSCLFYSYVPSAETANSQYPPAIAAVTVPGNGGFYNDVNLPDPFRGVAADSPDGLGLNSDSTTFYIQKDSLYWDGSAWVDTLTWLPTMHDATYDGSVTEWTSSAALPVLEDGQKYLAGACCTNVAGDIIYGIPIFFYYDVTRPQVTINYLMTYVSGRSSDDAPGEVVRVELKLTNTADNTTWNGNSWQNPGDWFTVGGAGHWSYFLPELTQGVTYEVKARAVDSAGNISDEQTVRFTEGDSSPVGGDVAGINRAEVLVPWLAGLILAVIGMTLVIRRKETG